MWQGDTFAPAATTLHSVEEPISSVQKSKSFLCKTEFCVYWYSQYFRGIGIFCLLFYFFSFLFPVGDDFSVSNFFSNCWADYSCILWSILFQHSEIVLLNLCIVNKICPNQISLSLFKIYMWEIYRYKKYICVCVSPKHKGSIVIELVQETLIL